MAHHPELVIIRPEPDWLALKAIARLLELGVHFNFGEGYALPRRITPEMVSARVILAPAGCSDLAPPGVRLIRFSDADWGNDTKIERLPVIMGLQINNPDMWKRLDSLSPKERIVPAIRRIHSERITRWSDVERYHLECLLLSEEIGEKPFGESETVRFVERVLSLWPERGSSCDEVAVTYPLLQFAHITDAPLLLERCRRLIDDFLANASLFRGVFSNFTSSREAGALRSEIAFQVCPALVRLSRLTNESRYEQIALEQILRIDEALADQDTGLWYLGTGASGRTPSLWARGCAFQLRALVDLITDGSETIRLRLLPLLQRASRSLVEFQNQEGALFQVVNEPVTRSRISATAWMTAALSKGIRLGLIGSEFQKSVEAGWTFTSRRMWDGLCTSICGAVTVSFDPHYYRSRIFLGPSYGHFALLAALEYQLLDRTRSSA